MCSQKDRQCALPVITNQPHGNSCPWVYKLYKLKLYKLYKHIYI